MARSRNIKPGFFKNEDLAECSVWARLIFAGLWTLADREGRLEDRPKRIKGELIPFDAQDVGPLLCELADRNFILRYEVEGQKFIQISKFMAHQSPHYSEKKSVIKPPSLPEYGPIKPPVLPEHSEKVSVMKRGSQPPDSLIPDSLIPDSLQRLSPSASLQAHPIANALGPNEEAAEPVLRANSSAPDCPYSAIAEAYHQELPELPSIVVLSPNRKRALQARWREVCTAEHLDSQGGLTFFRDFFRRIKQSEFLLGKTAPKRPGDRSFRADFDWILNPANFVKIVEGRYHQQRGRH